MDMDEQLHDSMTVCSHGSIGNQVQKSMDETQGEGNRRAMCLEGKQREEVSTSCQEVMATKTEVEEEGTVSEVVDVSNDLCLVTEELPFGVEVCAYDGVGMGHEEEEEEILTASSLAKVEEEGRGWRTGEDEEGERAKKETEMEREGEDMEAEGRGDGASGTGITWRKRRRRGRGVRKTKSSHEGGEEECVRATASDGVSAADDSQTALSSYSTASSPQLRSTPDMTHTAGMEESSQTDDYSQELSQSTYTCTTSESEDLVSSSDGREGQCGRTGTGRGGRGGAMLSGLKRGRESSAEGGGKEVKRRRGKAGKGVQLTRQIVTRVSDSVELCKIWVCLCMCMRPCVYEVMCV